MGIKCSRFHDHLPGHTRTTYVEIRRSVESENSVRCWWRASLRRGFEKAHALHMHRHRIETVFADCS